VVLPDRRKVRSIHGKNLVGGILQQREGGIVVAQRLLDARIGFVENRISRESAVCVSSVCKSEAANWLKPA
jgi:hypothetical protein